mmetsp:Transcript_136817/g.354978  ORF Transcript_136817/g.354978 Transcript_136817/m.354978 type:complete len:1326 (+) Transcript_136817:94-4071(+)|eukprot:CAMPEP_0115174314 /NCGR_PEP_ID=MMETSP0270-20121206/3773_1 /TAXON_ID=71861 /ORGANISM="Scrippsiella trochoidea, Strain CCMP3099" /LENGTH=1325 /DNA_ID=CAMNT_0002587145 /DNA_START=30 /DNA_END=4007 /DNA_ORIENTATION=-
MKRPGIFKKGHHSSKHHAPEGDTVPVEEFVQVQSALQELREDCEDLSENVELARATARNLQEQLRTEQGIHAELRTSLGASEARASQLEADVSQGEEECKCWAAACEASGEAAKSVHAEVAALRNELVQASEAERQQRVVGTAQKSQNDQLRTKLTNLEKTVAEAKAVAATEEGSALRSLTDEMEEARAHAKSEEARVGHLKSQVQAEVEIAACVREQLRADREDSESSRGRAHILETEMQEQVKIVTGFQEQLAALSALLVVSEGAVDKMEHEVHVGSSEVASLQQMYQEASARGDGLSEAVSQLESELAEQANSKSTQHDVSSDAFDETQNLEAAVANSKRLAAELEDRSNFIIDLQSQLQKLSGRVESATSYSGADSSDDAHRAEVAESELNECHCIIQDLRAELHGATEEIRNSDVAACHHISSSSDIEKTPRMRCEDEGAVQEHEELLAAFDRNQQENCAEEAELRAQVRSTSDSMDKLTIAEKAAMEDLHRMRYECDELRSSLQQAEDVIQAANHLEVAEEVASPARSGEVVDCSSDLQLKTELGDEASACQNLRIQLVALKAAVEHYEGELASQCAELASATKGEDAAAVKVNLLRSEVTELEVSRANGEKEHSELVALLDEERSSHLAAATAAQEAWGKQSDFNDRAFDLKQLQEELAEEREAHLSAASAAQAAWDASAGLRQELSSADELKGESERERDELKAELERERASHLTAATAAEDAWGKNSALSTEVMSEEIALEQSEVRHRAVHEELQTQAEELQRLRTDVAAADEESQQLREAVRSAQALATGSETYANELQAELQQVRVSSAAEDTAALVLELRMQLEQEEDLRAAGVEAAVAAACVDGSSREAELQKALHRALADKAELSEKLADAEYALQITSEAAAEDSDDSATEHVGIREARRLKMECAALESQLRQVSPHKRNTADFGIPDSTRQADSAASPQVWNTVQQLRAELAGREEPPSATAIHATPSFAVPGGVTELEHRASADSMGDLSSAAKPSVSSTLTFAPPTRNWSLSMRDVEGGVTSETCRDEGNPFEEDAESQADVEHVDAINPFAGEFENCHSEGTRSLVAIHANPFGSDAKDDDTKEDVGSVAYPLKTGSNSAIQRSPEPSHGESPRVTSDSREIEQRSSPSHRTKVTPSFGSSDDSTVPVELARLRGVLSVEEAACAEAREEAREARRALKEANVVDNDDDEVTQLRRALAEETAKSNRLGKHALRAEESRRRLLHELAEDAEAEADLVALAKVLGRAAKAIATISHEAPMQLPEEQPVALATPRACTPPASVPPGPRLGRLPSMPVKREADASDLM